MAVVAGRRRAVATKPGGNHQRQHPDRRAHGARITGLRAAVHRVAGNQSDPRLAGIRATGTRPGNSASAATGAVLFRTATAGVRMRAVAGDPGDRRNPDRTRPARTRHHRPHRLRTHRPQMADLQPILRRQRFAGLAADPESEGILRDSLRQTQTETFFALSNESSLQLVQQLRIAFPLRTAERAVLLVAQDLRSPLRTLLQDEFHHVPVLSFAEISNVAEVKVMGRFDLEEDQEVLEDDYEA